MAGRNDGSSVVRRTVRAGRAGYAALVGVPVDSVAMGGTVSSVGLVAAAIPTAAGWRRCRANSPAPPFPFAAQAAGA